MGIIILLIVGLILYQLWQQTDQELFKAKYLNRFKQDNIPVRPPRKMDDILDKISKHGIDSLTKEEKDFLERFSK